MIWEILSWAVGSWHIVEARMTLLTIARTDGPVSLLDLDARHFIAFCEGVLRESEPHAKALDELYEAARPVPPPDPATARAERRAQIDRLSRLFGG